ncbi:hypothetical protein ANN_18359 [Periplaneta americana]|uniref:Uncharacterized protein n=1 Tax=Periplaneta americana TaxID=6978 RepID=A0ABQ8SQ03_PERAM|nr:hypothetical protein ANN_18359 [Periplaneta americana]
MLAGGLSCLSPDKARYCLRRELGKPQGPEFLESISVSETRTTRKTSPHAILNIAEIRLNKESFGEMKQGNGSTPEETSLISALSTTNSITIWSWIKPGPSRWKNRRLRWAGHVARMGESRNAYRVLVGRPEGKRPLGRPRRRWEDNIKMDLREVGYDDRDWLNLAQDRDRWRAYVRAAMNLRFRIIEAGDESIGKSVYNSSFSDTLRQRFQGQEHVYGSACDQALAGCNEYILQVAAVNKKGRLRWAVHVARMDESRNAYRVLVGRPEGKRPLGRPRRRWEDNIKMDLREVGYGDREWINLSEDRDQWRAYVRAAMNLWVPSKASNWLFNDAVSTTRLFSVDEIGDSGMRFGEMRPRIRHGLPCVHITVGEYLGKNPTRTRTDIVYDACDCVYHEAKLNAIGITVERMPLFSVAYSDQDACLRPLPGGTSSPISSRGSKPFAISLQDAFLKITSKGASTS